MLLEFATLQLTHEELKEIYRALWQRAELEHLLMEEKQTAHPDHSLVHRVQDLLGKSDAELEALHEELDLESWEGSWYAYTEEWAWFRATQDVTAELKRPLSDAVEDENRVEARYRKNFEAYVAEISMLDPASKPTTERRPLPKKRQGKTK